MHRGTVKGADATSRADGNGPHGPVTNPLDLRTLHVVFERGLPRRSRRWLDALRPDTDLAEAEGLAAGLGLLTGEVARAASGTVEQTAVCAACGGPCAVVVVDLVGLSTTRKCRTCARRWTSSDDLHPLADEPAGAHLGS